MELENTRIVHAEEDADFDQIFAIREAVFERELGLAEEKQIDGFDHVAHRYLMVYNDRAVRCSRWRVTLGGNIRLDRLAVLKEYRGKGFGKALMQKMLTHIPKTKPPTWNAWSTKLAFLKTSDFWWSGTNSIFKDSHICGWS